MKVSFVILHFGDPEITKRCVQSINRMVSADSVSIVVVDNECLKPRSQRVSKSVFFVENEKDRYLIPVENDGGFSYANNIGYSFARDVVGADAIVVTNNDIEFLQEDFSEKVSSLAARDDCYVIGPDVIRASTGEHQNPMAPRGRTLSEVRKTIWQNKLALRLFPLAYPFLALREKRKKPAISSDSVAKSGSLVLFGACLVFLPAFVRSEQKAFSPETHFYYEEYILAHRCRLSGYNVEYTPELKVLHESGKSTDEAHATDRKRMRFMMENIVESAEVYARYLKEYPFSDAEVD